MSHGDLAGFRCLVDLVYAQRPTGLVSAAAELGVPAVDGLEFLIAQGAESFRALHRPPGFGPCDARRARAGASG